MPAHRVLATRWRRVYHRHRDFARIDAVDEGFEWDPAKAELNERKHGVSFVEARTVFRDRLAHLEADPLHSLEEDRYRIIGQSVSSTGGRLLVVVFTEHPDQVRIISARPARPRERRAYEQSYRE